MKLEPQYVAQITYALKNQTRKDNPVKILGGFDGFIDNIYKVVDKRHGPDEAFTQIERISNLATRIQAAAGKSTNFELSPVLEKIGGNGPIMVSALAKLGASCTYIGCVGDRWPHPLFEEFYKSSKVHSVAEPAKTTALEFFDGKLMFGDLTSLNSVTLEKIRECVGDDTLKKIISDSNGLAMLNWTMLPFMEDIMLFILNTLRDNCDNKRRRMFFDLSDPEKRSDQEVLGILNIIRDFSTVGKTTLSLNYKEAIRVAKVLYLPIPTGDESNVIQLCKGIRDRLEIDSFSVHLRSGAALSTSIESIWLSSAFVPKPIVSTGSGDNFNSGLMLGQLNNLDPHACLAMALCSANFYVRNGRSANAHELIQLLHQIIDE